MHVICVCCYRNEADIIEAFVRHTAAFCDELILLDHGSTDESPDIARHLQREGLGLHLLSDPTLGSVEVDQTNRLLQLAAHEFRADWILSLDADEFIAGAPDNSFLPRAVEDETFCLKIRSRTYYAHPTDREEILNPVERITHRLASEDAIDSKVFVPGWLVRRGPGCLTQGKHQYYLHTREAPAPFVADVALAHFSLRSPPQYAMKLAAMQLQKYRHISEQGDERIYYDKPYALLKESYRTFEESFASQRLGYKTLRAEEKFTRDPIAYRGAPLRYTPESSAVADRFVRELLELAEQLARSSQPDRTLSVRRLSIELTSGPSPGHTEVLNTTVDRARFHTVMLCADCPADATELHVQLRGDPGLIEIREMILRYAGARGEETYGVEELQKMVCVEDGGAVIAPTDVFRILISKDPVRLTFTGWRKTGAEAPDELLLRLRVEDRLMPAMLLSPAVLNAIATEHRELVSCREQLDAAQREAALYKRYLSQSAYAVGSVINFTTNGNSSFYIGEGWSHAEEWGTWTDGDRAMLRIRFAEAPKRPLRLNAQLLPFLHATHPQMQARVRVGGDEIALWTLASAEFAAVCATIPAEKLRETDCEITLEILNPASPLELGISNDPRRLGVGVLSVDFQWAEAGGGNVS